MIKIIKCFWVILNKPWVTFGIYYELIDSVDVEIPTYWNLFLSQSNLHVNISLLLYFSHRLHFVVIYIDITIFSGAIWTL